MKVLVVGAAGQLGQAMVTRLGSEHDVTAWTRQDIDLTRHQDVREAIGELGRKRSSTARATTRSMPPRTIRSPLSR